MAGHVRRQVTALAALLLTVAVFGAAAAQASDRYVVLYKGNSVPSGASTTVSAAGGSVIGSYDAIGVVVAQSSSSAFRTALLKDRNVDEVAATTGFATKLADPATSADSASTGDLPNAPATDSDSLSGLQWDMRQIHASEAHAVTGGSRSVLVGDIDTGLDFTHPDLAPNYDADDSTDCTSGAPQPLGPGNDANGHGTHTAGTIAAAANGVGIVGVAPNVRIAGVKAGNNDGVFFPEAVVCAFMWAGSHHFDVTNNSYFADPYLYNCRNDPVQRAIWKAEQRAIRYAMNQGVTVVAAAGNESDDISHPTQDVTSPDDPPGAAQTRDVTNACVVIPVEIPGVIGVSATGNTRQTDGDDDPDDYLKSFYSSYGVSGVDVAAPGGDSIFGVTPQAPNGRVLSTWPLNVPCARSVQEPPPPAVPTARYCYAQGTSMASPHVAGIAALVVSRYGRAANPQNGQLSPGKVLATIQQTANPQPCPTLLPGAYEAFTSTQSGETQECQGGPGHNSWYGAGQADALNAVTHASGS